jgi:hypothetical protein
MDKHQAIRIISETFQNPFDKNRFTYFIKNLLNKIDESKEMVVQSVYIKEMFRDYVKSYERIGTYADPEGKKLDILIVNLQKETTLERARTAQRNFIARYLKDRGEKDAGLIAFVSPDTNDWRFSFVKMEYDFDKDNKVKQEFTPARRYSYLVGEHEASHTAQSRMFPILSLDDENRNPTLAQIEELFSVEKATKEFFEKYRDLFLTLKDAIDQIVKSNKKVKNDFDKNNINTIDFAKKLLGQIVFLYFLQKKGWFGVGRDADWGAGPKNFLRQLFNKHHADYKNFFNDILEPLFYSTLAVERPEDYSDKFNCKIPFLNGGLFDPINDYNWLHIDILLPDELFSNLEKTEQGDTGNGILDIFDRYNFTVKEDEPLEKEVAIDPEMLGKVFENLLEVKDRKSKGTYYTPREIVHYMCQQSLVNYLATELNAEDVIASPSSPVIARSPNGTTKQSLSTKDDIETLIKYGEHLTENEARVKAKGEETDTYYYKMPETIRQNAKFIDEKLADIKVCDPAIGSGAFLVGMMTEIVKARRALNSYIKGEKDRTLYDFKRNAIQNCLYGVDIDLGAVEIAKLRLWLSLVVDEEDREKIEPLPNLDYKIMQGNSLFEEYEGIRLIDENLFQKTDSKKELIENLNAEQKKLQKELISLHSQRQIDRLKIAQREQRVKALIKEVEKLSFAPKSDTHNLTLVVLSSAKEKAKQLLVMQKQFFDITHKTHKDKLKSDIERLTWELIEVTLSEQGKIDKIKKIVDLRKNNTKPFFLWKLHFAEVFQDKGGFDIVIANPPYVSVKEIEESDKKAFSRVFECGQGRFNLFTLFIEQGHKILKNGGILTFILPEGLYSNVEYRYIRKYILDKSLILYIALFSNRVFDAAVDTSIISIMNKPTASNNFPIIKDLTQKIADIDQNLFNELADNIFLVNLNDKSKEIIFKLLRINGDTLDSIIEFQQGIIYSGQSKQKVFSNTCVDKKYKKVLDGRDVLKWKVNWQSKAENRFICYSDKLHRPRDEQLFLAKEKILLPRKSTRIYGAYDSQQYYCLNTAYVGLLRGGNQNEYNLKFILAILNSNLINYIYSKMFFGWQVTIPALNAIIIPKAKEQQLFVSFVDKILAITKADDYPDNPSKQTKVKEYERQIDQMVYKLYGLTPAEIKIVEDSNKKE